MGRRRAALNLNLKKREKIVRSFAVKVSEQSYYVQKQT